VTVGVWVGNFDRTPLRDSTGVTGAGPIFHAVMLAAAKDRGSDTAHEILPPASDLREETICALSGMRANAWCPTREREWVKSGAEPRPCDWHHQSDEGPLTIYPPEYRAWAAETAAVHAVTSRASAPERGEASRPRPVATSAHLNSSAPALAITNPPDGALYSIDPTLRREFQALPLRAVTARPTTLTWLVDGKEIGAASSERSISWPLAVGSHEIQVRDPDGRLARTSIVVR